MTRDPRATPVALPSMTAPPAVGSALPTWGLRAAVIAGAWAERWHLRLATTSVLGREPSELPGERGEAIADPNASRRHARLVVHNDTLSVEDLNATNGTWVNGRRISTRPLDPGDALRLGDSVFVVTYDSVRKETPAPTALLGHDGQMVRLRASIAKVAPSALPVLVMGPTGTGKELVAHALHHQSGRRGPFVTLNCAALPPNLVESALFGHRRGAFTGATGDSAGAFVRAAGGTLLLDEVGEMPLATQAKLLRALDPGEVVPVGATTPIQVSARVVAATNVALLEAVNAGEFRADLYERLNGIILNAPALSDRRGDIPLLFRSFVGDRLGKVPVEADFAEALLVYDWPRNVREIKHAAERIVVLYGDASRLKVTMLDDALQLQLRRRRHRTDAQPGLLTRRTSMTRAAAGPHLASPSWPPTKDELIALLADAEGNVSTVARRVGRNRKQVYRWMEQLDIARGTGRD